MNYIHATIIYIAYMFVIILTYLVTSGPFEDIVTEIEGAGTTTPEVATVGGYVRSAYSMVFAIAGIVPTVWFVAWTFKREPDWYYE
jgi:hypothetical protein